MAENDSSSSGLSSLQTAAASPLELKLTGSMVGAPLTSAIGRHLCRRRGFERCPDIFAQPFLPSFHLLLLYDSPEGKRQPQEFLLEKSRLQREVTDDNARTKSIRFMITRYDVTLVCVRHLVPRR